MPSEILPRNRECNETQLAAIRELMLAAATRGEWLTLAEIANPTEFGEASISAQLRHLRKSCHGRYRVEKRRRRSRLESRRAGAGDHGGELYGVALWEYQVRTPE
jgi:hypothetical protein